jgi:hypothetical protein
MPNGILRLYNKLNNATLVNLNILGTFNIEENLNETPSNMKVKVITSNTYREEFEVNTVAYHEDTNSWWVIKSDESTYITTGEYEHEIQLVEYLEFYAYRHLPNCAFAPNTYTLEQMLNRLFNIAKLSVTVNYPTFLDEDKIMPFLSFENFTVANAIKNIARAINAIPKMKINISPSFLPELTFVNRNGIDSEIKNLLDTQFPIAYEKNMNSNDQFTTRSVSNITNAKSSSLVIAPKSGGFKNVVENAIIYDSSNRDNSRVYLPSKIDRVEFVRLYPPVIISRFIVGSSTSAKLFEGYYLDKEEVKNAIIDNLAEFSIFVLADLEALTMPEPDVIHQINLNDVLGTSYTGTLFRGLHTLKSKFDFDTSDKLTGNYDTIQKVKDKTIHWTPFTNELVLGKTIRDGLTVPLTGASHYRSIVIDQKTSGGSTEQIRIDIDLKVTGFFESKVGIDELLVQVGYYPIADIKVSIDNDNDAQDEKYFNQSGKIIDAVSVSKLITSHTNDSVEGTKIRNARHDSIGQILELGQLVRDNNQIYVISQRSIDGHVKNGNEYYNVIYTLSRNRVARSENIVADSSVISYKTPDDNLVFRTQLYKDYIELSLQNINQDIPYLNMTKALSLSSTLAGTNFDYTVLARNRFSVPAGSVGFDESINIVSGSISPFNFYSNVMGYRVIEKSLLDPIDSSRPTKIKLTVPDTNFLVYSTGGISSTVTFLTSANATVSTINLIDIMAFIDPTKPRGTVEINVPSTADKVNITLMTSYLSTDFGGLQSGSILLNDSVYGVKVFAQRSVIFLNYVKNPTVFDLHKSKLTNVNWQSNNLLGYRLDSTGLTYVQTPIVYTDILGKATQFELLFLDTNNLIKVKNDFNVDFDEKASSLIPFEDLTRVDNDFWNLAKLVTVPSSHSIKVEENTYDKDPFEIPVFEYMIQGNDDYNANGNIVISNDLFSTFTGNILYHYTINNTTRFTAENANSLYDAPSGDTDKRVTFTRSGASNQILDLDIYSTFSGTPNASLIKNIGVYAKVGALVKFLFAINDYVENATTTPANDKSNIRVYINNWKI